MSIVFLKNYFLIDFFTSSKYDYNKNGENNMIKNIFFDRDGTLGTLKDVRLPGSMILFPETRHVLRRLKDDGFKIFIATNQSCIARGTDGGYDFAKEFSDYGADDWFICPHDSGDQCDCRKPKPGLLEQAIRKHGLVREECIYVGDRETDIECAHRAGMRAVLLSVQKPNTAADYTIVSLFQLEKLLAEGNL